MNKVMREGKTAKDKKSGAWQNRLENGAKRASWSRGELKAFPKECCNGKRNRLNK
jgi:hypothetical protein